MGKLGKIMFIMVGFWSAILYAPDPIKRDLLSKDPVDHSTECEQPDFTLKGREYGGFSYTFVGEPTKLVQGASLIDFAGSALNKNDDGSKLTGEEKDKPDSSSVGGDRRHIPGVIKIEDRFIDTSKMFAVLGRMKAAAQDDIDKD